MRIALVRPDFRGLTHPPDMPNGMLYVAAYLEENGFYPDVFDLNKQGAPDWAQYDVIGFSMLPLARKQVYELIDEIKSKNPQIKIVLGGVFPSSMPEYLIKHLKIDAIVVGEGEETFYEYVCWVEGEIEYENKPLKDIKGLCTKEHGLHESRPLLNINKIPSPAWHHSRFDWFSMTYANNNPEFEANGLILSKEKVAMISGSRGCPNSYKPCTFCDTPRFWQKKYRTRTSYSIFQEIAHLYTHEHVRTFSFNDDAFPVNKRQCMEFCALIKKAKMQIAWKSDTRADVLDEEMIIAMKESGCFMVAIGVESGSEKIRKSINKNLNIDKAKEAIKLLKKHGIIAYVLLMVGNPGETEETIMETKNFLIETQPDIATWVTGVMMCAGTELYIMAKKNELIDDNYWIQKNNGMPNYEGELSPEEISRFAGLLNGWKKK